MQEEEAYAYAETGAISNHNYTNPYEMEEPQNEVHT